MSAASVAIVRPRATARAERGAPYHGRVTASPAPASAARASDRPVPLLGFLTVLGSAALFGTLGPLSRFAYDLGVGPAAWVAWRGLIGLLTSLGYHWGPWPYANRGLADPVFLLMFGVVAVVATYFVQAAALIPAGPWWQRSAAVPLAVWLIGLPMGALVTSVLVIDDIRDRHWDAQKGWRTGAVRWGLRWSRAEFAALVVFAYLAPLLMVALGWGVWMLLPLLTAPLAWQALQAVSRFDDTQALLPWTPKVARLGLIYAALQAVALALPPG